MQQFQLRPVRDPPIRIPLFEDALAINGSKGVILADWRGGSSTALQRAVEAAPNFDPEKNLLINEYSVEAASALKKALPSWARVIVKFHSDPEQITLDVVDDVQAAGLTGLMLYVPGDISTVQPLLSQLHSRGLILVLYVHYYFRTLEELEAMRDMGVDYVLTEHNDFF